MSGKAASGNGSIRKKTITSRNGKQYTYWEGRYTVGYNPRTGRQIQKSITGSTQREVAKKLKEATLSVDDGTYIEPSKLTLSEWMDLWVKEYLVKQKPLTVDSYKRSIEKHIKPALGAVKLPKLTTNQIQAFYSELYETLSPKTVKNIHGILHRALNQAVAAGSIPRNPSDGCEIKRPQRPNISPMEPDDISAFIAAAAKDDYYNLFVVATFTGMRQGELLGLTWDCVDFDNGIIKIKQQLQRIDKQYFLTSTKSDRSRTIAPAQLVMDSLKNERQKQEKNSKDFPDLYNNPQNLVFTTELGKNLVRRTVDKHFKSIVEDAGIPDLRFHDLRHTYAVNSIMAGDDLKTLQSNLGHATAAFTMDVYAHVNEKMKHDSGDRMQAFFEAITNKGK